MTLIRRVLHPCPGLPVQLLTGSPAHGGFGLLPLCQHTMARRAAMGACLVARLVPPPAASFQGVPAGARGVPGGACAGPRVPSPSPGPAPHSGHVACW